jgi:hypothetical protein
VIFSAFRLDEFSIGFSVPGLGVFPLSFDLASASPDGPRTNRLARCASGIGAGCGGTITALRTTTALRDIASGSAIGVISDKLGSELTTALDTCGFVGATDKLLASMGNLGFGGAGSLDKKVDNGSELFNSNGCSSRGATGARRAGAGRISMVGRRSGYLTFGDLIKSGRRIVCAPLIASGGLEMIS